MPDYVQCHPPRRRLKWIGEAPGPCNGLGNRVLRDAINPVTRTPEKQQLCTPNRNLEDQKAEDKNTLPLE